MEQYYSPNKNSTRLKSKIKKKIFPVGTDGIKKIAKGRAKVMRYYSKKAGARSDNQRERIRLVRLKRGILLPGRRKREAKNYDIIHISSTHNNTIYTAGRSGGRTDYSVSTGMCGFKNTRQSTSYASQAAAEKLVSALKKCGHIRVKLRGLGPGKLSGVRALHQLGVRIVSLEECTPLPHNGCRSPKRRRL